MLPKSAQNKFYSRSAVALLRVVVRTASSRAPDATTTIKQATRFSSYGLTTVDQTTGVSSLPRPGREYVANVLKTAQSRQQTKKCRKPNFELTSYRRRLRCCSV